MIDLSSALQPAAMQASSWAMLGGGLLAFISPCVLPMLPVYALYLVGANTDDLTQRASWGQLLRRCLGLLVSFVFLFTLIGAGAGVLGSALKNADRGVLNIISGALMIVFGLWLLELFHWKGIAAIMGRIFAKSKSADAPPRINGFWGAFGFGLLLALSWTPCMTPLLANALILAASQENATMVTGMLHLAIFALGLCLPMLLFMLFYQWLKGALGWLRSHQMLLRRIGGGLMVAYGLYLVITSL